MQQYYFSLHDTTQQLFLHREPAAETEFIWLDYTREDVRQHLRASGGPQGPQPQRGRDVYRAA